MQGVFHAQNYFLEAVDIETTAGRKLDLKRIVTNLSYYEDLYGMCSSGEITIVDSQGFIELMQMTGHEYLHLKLSKYEGSPDFIEKDFVVYKISNEGPLRSGRGYSYVLHFCSEEVLMSEISIVEGYYDGKVSDVVKKIMQEDLRIPSSKIATIQETTGLYDFNIPNLKALEAISWVSVYGKPNSSNSIGNDMLFFENKNGYNFQSLQTLFDQSPVATYKYQAKNLSAPDQDMVTKFTTILNYEFVKPHDVLYELSKGTYNGVRIKVNSTTGEIEYESKSFAKDIKLPKGAGSLVPDIKNRKGKNLSDNTGFRKVIHTNSNLEQVGWIKDNPGSVQKNFDMENAIISRRALINMSNHALLKILIPGDTNLTVGQKIEVLIPSILNEQEKDFYSGNYLIVAVRHIIQAPSIFETVLELARQVADEPFKVGEKYADL